MSNVSPLALLRQKVSVPNAFSCSGHASSAQASARPLALPFLKALSVAHAPARPLAQPFLVTFAAVPASAKPLSSACRSAAKLWRRAVPLQRESLPRAIQAFWFRSARLKPVGVQGQLHFNSTSGLTLPSSGQPKAGFACFRLPLMSNVRRLWKLLCPTNPRLW